MSTISKDVQLFLAHLGNTAYENNESRCRAEGTRLRRRKIGTRIRQRREELGLDRRQLAKLVSRHWTPDGIRSIEEGCAVKGTVVETLYPAIARALGVTLEELTKGVEP